jgi:excisionase family DNA binding protein
MSRRNGRRRAYEEQMFSVRAMAEHTGLSRFTLYKWIREGRLGYVRLGSKTLRIPASALDALIEAGQRGPRDPAA